MNDNELQKRAAPVGEHSTWDYRIAPGGDGPLADEWADKPHRLVYDLCREIERLHAALAPQEPAPMTGQACSECDDPCSGYRRPEPAPTTEPTREKCETCGHIPGVPCRAVACEYEHAWCPSCRPQETKP